MNKSRGGKYHCGHLSGCVWRGVEETATSFEHLSDELDVGVGEIFEEDFETMEDDVLRSNAEFCEFGDVSNVQESRICKCLLPLQTTEIVTQLLMS